MVNAQMKDLATRAGITDLSPELVKYTELVIAECAYRMELLFEPQWPARPTWSLYDHWDLPRPAWIADPCWRPVNPHNPAARG